MKLSLSTMQARSQPFLPTEDETARLRLLEDARFLLLDLYPLLPPDLPTTRDLEGVS